MKVLMGIRDGVLTVVDPETERHTSIPWPPPPDKNRYGSWRPARVGHNEDGSPVLLWNWEQHRGLDGGPSGAEREDAWPPQPPDRAA